MKKIYLASASKARAQLLKQMGFKFKVIPSHAREVRKARGLSYSALVKQNALYKARAVAEKVRGGVIIAADTIVVQDKKIFGKPKDLRDARRMLKTISRKPQWLYTGLAVIDKDNAKIKLGYEKTKVLMDVLNDEEIDDYFALTSPMGKAGSFDIQGQGACLIKRIEGCFYNVVGLPLRKLCRILKEMHITLSLALFFLFSAGLSFLLSGCSTEYNIVTGEEESFYYSTDKEVQMGKSIAVQVEKEYKLVDDPLVQKRVEDVGKKIAAVCDRKEIDYSFRVLNDDEVNAVSLPGGIVYVNKGLVEKVASDDELAGVLAHELGHIVARHSIKKLQAYQGYSLLRLLVAVTPQVSSGVGVAADAAFAELLLGFTREDELLADQLGTRYAKLAGFNPHGMIHFLEKLQDINKRKPLLPKSYFKTHPYVPDRIRVVKQELGENIDFEDYINIEQTVHK